MDDDRHLAQLPDASAAMLAAAAKGGQARLVVQGGACFDVERIGGKICASAGPPHPANWASWLEAGSRIPWRSVAPGQQLLALVPRWSPAGDRLTDRLVELGELLRQEDLP